MCIIPLSFSLFLSLIHTLLRTYAHANRTHTYTQKNQIYQDTHKQQLISIYAT